MLKPFLLNLAVFCLGVSVSRAQSVVSGSLVDTTSQRKVSNAVVALIGAKDSILYRYVRSDANGKFSIPAVKADSFIIQVSHPDFADYVDYFRTSTGKDHNVGNVFITPKTKLLEEVIVRQNMSVRIKGDTIEYKADSFKVAEGSSVKDLLRRFPGITVDKDGKITAQGQTVSKVLVDGEEFFSDDPAVVIENLRADAVDVVQSFDKKSEQAEFTGVDDGSKSKTLNLVLKEDKKKGVIGKVVIGGGTSERYSNQAMLNFFKGKKKVAVYGIMSNTGVTGLGWGDRDQFSQGFDMDDAEIMGGGGMIMINNDGDNDFGDWENNYNDEGIPQSVKAGAHYSNKFNKDKSKVNGNYSYKDVQVNAVGNTLTKYILPDSAYYNRENHTSTRRNTEQLFNGLYDVKIDSMSSLRFKLNGKISRNQSNTFSDAATLDDDQNLVNNNLRRNDMQTDGSIFLGSVLWRQKFRKAKRTLSLNASYKQNRTEQEGFLNSRIDYYNNGSIYFQDTTDQYKDYLTTSNTLTTKAVYTEPMGKKGVLEFNYIFSRMASESDRKTFDAAFDGKYTSLNDTFSINYGLEYLSNSAGVKYQYNGKKLTASIGSNFGVSNYRQNDSTGTQVRNFRFYNLFPQARLNYKLGPQRGLNFSYSGSPNPPTINQLQPISENTNPLFIVVGNPELKQSFNHNFSMFYNDYKVLSGRSIWANAGFNPVQNAIVTSMTTNDSGRTVQQFINTQGNFSYYGYVSYGFKLKKSEINLGVNVNANGSRYVSIVNNVLNRNTQNRISVGPSISKWKQDKYDFYVNSNVTYNFSGSNTQSLNANFFGQEHEARFNYYFNKRFSIGSGATAYLRQKNDAFTGNNNFTIWDANMSYKVFKKRNGVFKLEVNDILKERRGYDRSFYGSTITERNYNTLSRYALLSFTWNFTKNPGSTTAAK